MLFNKVVGHVKDFFLKLKIGKKDEILSKYHLVACHFKIVSTLVIHSRRPRVEGFRERIFLLMSLPKSRGCK